VAYDLDLEGGVIGLKEGYQTAFALEGGREGIGVSDRFKAVRAGNLTMVDNHLARFIPYDG